MTLAAALGAACCVLERMVRAQCAGGGAHCAGTPATGQCQPGARTANTADTV